MTSNAARPGHNLFGHPIGERQPPSIEIMDEHGLGLQWLKHFGQLVPSHRKELGGRVAERVPSMNGSYIAIVDDSRSC